MLILYPAIIFLVLCGLSLKGVSRNKMIRIMPFIALIVAIFVLSKDLNQFFAIGSWRPFNASLYPANLSMFFCFTGIIIKEFRISGQWAFLGLFIIGALIHPVMALFVAGFYLPFLLPGWKKELKTIFKIIAAILIPGLLISLFLKDASNMDTSQFIQYYIFERHPWHYHVPDYKQYNPMWLWTFTGISVMYLIPIFYGIKKRSKYLVISTATAMIFFITAVTLQFIFIDIIPLKFIAYLGPSRYTTFGLWSVLVCWILMLGLLIKEKPVSPLPVMPYKALLLLIFSLIISGASLMDDPWQPPSLTKRNLFSFVHNTPRESVFLTYSQALNTDMRIIGKRNVLISKEFPFAESRIKEHAERYTAVYGSRLNRISEIQYFRSLKPEDWKNIAEQYGLDFLLIEKDYSDSFNSLTPVWEEGDWQIFALKDFKL